MRPFTRLRGRTTAFSALYGAFAVILVSTLVLGVVLSQSVLPSDAPRARGDRLADLFLDTLLRSTVADRRTFGEAVSAACLNAACPPGPWNVSGLSSEAERLAGPLARALGRTYSLALARQGAPLLHVGDLQSGTAASLSQAELYHASDREVLSLAVLLSRA